MPVKATSEQMISIIDELHLSCPGKKIKQTDIVEALAKQGITITKSAICKNEKVRDYLNKVNGDKPSLSNIKEIVYKPLNIQELSKMTREQIIAVIIQREEYYSSCAKLASTTKKQAEAYKKQLEDEFKNKNSSENKELKDLKEENKSLKALINNHILPEMANDLLGEEIKNRSIKKPTIITGMDIIDDSVDLDTGEVLDEDKYENSILNSFLR